MLKRGRYKTAVALQYGREELSRGAAPAVSLAEHGANADEIVRLARRFGVPVVEDERLAQVLRSLPPDEPIPRALFEAVALILHKIEPPQDRQIGGGGSRRR